MFGSNRKNSPKSRKRFWSFGRKATDEQQDRDNSSVEEDVPASSDVVLEPNTCDKANSPSVPHEDSSSEASYSAIDVSSEKEKRETSSDDGNKRSINAITDSNVSHSSETNQGAPSQEVGVLPEEVADVVIVSPEIASQEIASQETASRKEVQEKKKGFFARMQAGLSKTRQSLVGGVATLLVGKKKIDDELLEELEMQLITADIGVDATSEIIENLTEKMKRKELNDIDALMSSLKHQLTSIIEPCNQPLMINDSKQPYVILVVGVNGVGKTTTIGKLANQLKRQGHRVMLAAGDTFRAAAVEQLQEWGHRNEVPVIAQGHGSDSASVVYDAYEAAKARQYDVLIADTAGRLHNKEHLMTELKKVKRVLGRLDSASPHEVMLVVDAGTGQNAISQATLFNEAVGLTGMTLTKLDGTAKGGIVFALAKKMQLPIRFLGVGEQIEDLRPFSSEEFVDALFTDTQFSETGLQEEANIE